jgi:hypothetical protein
VENIVLYRIIKRRPSGGTYGPWQPVEDRLIVDLSDEENEIEFSAGEGNERIETVQCRCADMPGDHLHRRAPLPS